MVDRAARKPGNQHAVETAAAILNAAPVPGERQVDFDIDRIGLGIDWRDRGHHLAVFGRIAGAGRHRQRSDLGRIDRRATCRQGKLAGRNCAPGEAGAGRHQLFFDGSAIALVHGYARTIATTASAGTTMTGRSVPRRCGAVAFCGDAVAMLSPMVPSQSAASLPPRRDHVNADFDRGEQKQRPAHGRCRARLLVSDALLSRTGSVRYPGCRDRS